jgi:hypothetical protein
MVSGVQSTTTCHDLASTQLNDCWFYKNDDTIGLTTSSSSTKEERMRNRKWLSPCPVSVAGNVGASCVALLCLAGDDGADLACRIRCFNQLLRLLCPLSFVYICVSSVQLPHPHSTQLQWSHLGRSSLFVASSHATRNYTCRQPH